MKNLPLLRGSIISIIEGLLLSMTFSSAIRAQSSSAPVYEITPEVSKISFAVKASISLEGTFKKWDASLKFTSTDPSTGVLDVKIEADSANTGSGFKDDKLKGKDFLQREERSVHYISLHDDSPDGPQHFPGSRNVHHTWRFKAGDIELRCES